MYSISRREGNTLAQTGTGLGQLEGLTQNSRVNRVADCCYRITAWLWIQTVSVKIRNLEQRGSGHRIQNSAPTLTRKICEKKQDFKSPRTTEKKLAANG